MRLIRILLVDDNPEFLESATRFLSTDPSIEIVGGVLSGAEALAEVVQVKPDLVLMDWGMPGMNGLEAACCIKARSGAPSVVILTLRDDIEYRTAAQAAGMDGYVTKSEFGTVLLPLIHALFDDVAAGAGRVRQIQSP